MSDVKQFSARERSLLLGVKGVGPTVIGRLEQLQTGNVHRGVRCLDTQECRVQQRQSGAHGVLLSWGTRRTL